MPLTPYMTDVETEIILDYLTRFRPRRCLEWGIGGSTVQFSQFDFIEKWVGIEWHKDWIERVQSHVGPHVSLHQAEPPSTDVPYGSIESIDAFVNHPAIDGAFDFIFIDGDYRWQCLEKAARLISESGFCMVHDTARKDIHPHFRHFHHHRILTEGELNGNNDWHQGLTIVWNGERSL